MRENFSPLLKKSYYVYEEVLSLEKVKHFIKRLANIRNILDILNITINQIQFINQNGTFNHVTCHDSLSAKILKVIKETHATPNMHNRVIHFTLP